MAFAAQIKSHVQSALKRYSISMLLRALTLFLLPLCISAAPFPLKSDAKIIVLIFISSECPISNKLAPEIERLSHKFPTNDVIFKIVYPNASDTAEKISSHRADYHLTANYRSDPQHELVKIAGATVTPEVAVFDANRELAYRGRINDRFLALGKDRPKATRNDLEDAISALLAGKKPKHPRTEAIGCFIQN
jgi:thiol-disulfide isomerase/thioredoxin